MTDISDAADLITTAREALLGELLPALPVELRYSALMIANGMAIAAREHRLGSDAARSEATRLRNQLADSGLSPGTHDLPALRKAIATAIRAGYFDEPARAAALMTDLARTAEALVAISNPKALRPGVRAAATPET